MFGVCAAAAIAGGKVNLLLQFDSPPSAAQVMSRAIAAFTQLQQDRGIFAPFFVNCAMIFDDASSRWVPLERSSQVVHNCQVYLFQPDVSDVAGPIPDPIPASTFLVSYRSPERAGRDDYYGTSPRGLMPTDPDLSRFPVERNLSIGYADQQPPPHWHAHGKRHHSHQPQPYDDSLSPEQRAILRREADKFAANTFVPGESILKEERDKEDQKLQLPLDSHRDRVREETRKFASDISPERGRQL